MASISRRFLARGGISALLLACAACSGGTPASRLVTPPLAPAGATRGGVTPTDLVAEPRCPDGARLENGACVAHRGPAPVVVQALGPPPPVVPAGMVHIPGGTFDMGSNEGGDDEKPVHAVRLAPFSIDRTEVTVAAYAVCVGAGRCTTADHGRKDACNAGKSDRRDHPINCVDWSQAAAYCAYAGKRLPTEEEWEYVARGPEGRIYPWGDAEPSSQLCWSRDAGQGTCAVGSHPSGASPFGVLDMAGDALEWTKSPYCSYSGGDCAESFRVVRGGSWGVLAAMAVRGGVRGKLAPSYRSHYLGFRCAQGD